MADNDGMVAIPAEAWASLTNEEAHEIFISGRITAAMQRSMRLAEVAPVADWLENRAKASRSKYAQMKLASGAAMLRGALAHVARLERRIKELEAANDVEGAD